MAWLKYKIRVSRPVSIKMKKTLRQIAGTALSSLPILALANYDVNIPAPHSPISDQIYGLHMEILWVCLAIFVVVFGVMFYSVFAHRKSKGAVAAHFHMDVDSIFNFGFYGLACNPNCVGNERRFKPRHDH